SPGVMADGGNRDLRPGDLTGAARQEVLARDATLAGIAGCGLGGLVGAPREVFPERMAGGEMALVGLLELRVQHDQQRDDRRRDRFPVHQVVGKADEVVARSEEYTSELQSQSNLVCRLLLEKKKKKKRLC